MRTSTSSLSLALTALVVALALAACASGSARAAEGDGVQVTVLLYSGRPNPTFTLTAEQADRVRQLVAAAQPDPGFRGGSVLPSILGYNGVLVEGLPAPLAVYGGRIEVQDREGKRVVSDGGALESFLLEAAAQSKTLDSEQLRFIQASRDKQQS
ncbi:MAG: hypothetical protein QOH06_1951 [Acidobacteriota bacterium]|jgi:hypothetical protein|nr:hypothetical protein [Acidobacteriota bacterium]